jgi:hypothetical protein
MWNVVKANAVMLGGATLLCLAIYQALPYALLTMMDKLLIIGMIS